MNARSVRSFPSPRLLWLGLVSCIASIQVARAQEHVTFVSFTNTWRYNQAGQNLGTNWVAPEYDDIADPWQSGPALLGVENPLSVNYNAATLVPNVIPTPLRLLSGGGSNGVNIAYYFRTAFTNSLTNLTGVELWATNLVDDGCVIYLNGVRAGNIRLTNANPSYLTLANGGPAVEGQFDNVTLPASLLNPGENSLAVEVHQSATNSSDIAFAMRLVAVISSPLVITSQPPATLGAYVGNTLTLAVGISGGPAFYQWQRNGSNLAGETSAALNIPAANAAHAGSYRCMVTNSISSVTSETAVVSVVADIIGPRALEARVLETGATNIIHLIFDETMLNTTTSPNRNFSNYRVIASGTTNQLLSITNVQIAGTSILIRVNAASNWVVGDGYYVVLNNLMDARTNVIAPNTIVPISWPRRFDLLAPDAVWSFHAAAIFDGAVYDEDWTAAEYIEGSWWAAGPGIFYGGPVTVSQCLGPAQTLVGYQPEPILFRTTFQWPSNYAANARLTLRRTLDDGMVLYLNGREIFRSNVVGTINFYTRASGSVANAACVTNNVDVDNLLPGTNWLAAAVVQSPSANEADVVFGLGMSATVNVPSSVPDNPVPLLQIAPLGANAVRFSWDVYGFALESTTNLSLGFGSYPDGPWIPVANMSNPYTNSLANPERFFRLKK